MNIQEFHIKLIMVKGVIKAPSPELSILFGKFQKKPKKKSLLQKLKSLFNGR